MGRPRDIRRLACSGVIAVIAVITFAAAGCSTEPAATAAPAVTTQSTSPAPRTTGPPAEGPAAPTVAPMAGSAPVRVTIEAIGVDAELMDLGLQDDGTMEVPPGAFPAGWYTGGPTPGEMGPAIIAGHVHFNDELGVFADLQALHRGDEVVVTRADDSAAVFRVTGSEQFAKTRFPTDLVYGNIDHAGLRLITCGGLDQRSGTYEANLVVFAELVRAVPTTRG